MVTTPLDILRKWFDGNDLNEEIIEYVERGAPRSHLDALRAHYRAYVAQEPGLPPRTDYELRPYVSALWQADPLYASGVAGSLRDFGEPEDVTRTVNVLKHFLLYCHSVAIDNPLVLFLDMLSSGASDRSVALHRVFAANVLRLMFALKDLIDQHVVVFIEPNTDIHNRRVQLLTYEEVAKVASVADFSDFPGWDPTASESEKTGDMLFALESLKFNLVANRVHSGAVTAYLPFRHCETLLTRILMNTAIEVAVHVDSEQRQRLQNAATELGYLRELLSLPLPTFSRLSPKEILAIRSGNQFIQLRQGLEQGLRELDSVDASGLGYPQQVRKILSSAIARRREDLEVAVRGSALLSASRKGLRNLVVSGVPSVVAAALGGAGAAAGAFVFSEATQLAIEWFSQRKQRAATAAYATHALLFQPERI